MNMHIKLNIYIHSFRSLSCTGAQGNQILN